MKNLSQFLFYYKFLKCTGREGLKICEKQKKQNKNKLHCHCMLWGNFHWPCFFLVCLFKLSQPIRPFRTSFDFTVKRYYTESSFFKDFQRFTVQSFFVKRFRITLIFFFLFTTINSQGYPLQAFTEPLTKDVTEIMNSIQQLFRMHAWLCEHQ